MSGSGGSAGAAGATPCTKPTDCASLHCDTMASSCVGKPIALLPSTPAASETEVDDVRVGDIDGDGQPDLVLVGQNVGVFYLPHGTTSPIVIPSLGQGGVLNVHIADYNGDGTPDVQAENMVADGTMLFAGEVTATNGFSTATGDFDEDGIADLIGAPNGAGGMLLIDLGRPGFAWSETQIPNPFEIDSAARPPLVGDSNGDGHLDLVAWVGGNIVTLLGDGKGGFPTQVTTSDPDTILYQSGSLCDLDGDGKADWFLTYEGVGNGEMRLASGGGHFGATQFFTVGNGRLYRCDKAGKAIYDGISPGSGGALWQDRYTSSPVSTQLPLLTNGVEPVDYDKDGKTDLVTAYGGTIGLSTGASGLSTWAPIFETVVTDVATWGDLNADGVADLVQTNQTQNLAKAIVVSFSDGVGGLANQTMVALPASVAVTDLSTSRQVLVYDVDDDTLPDIISSAGTALYWSRNLGGDSFATSVLLATLPASTVVHSLTVGSFSGQARPDVIVAASGMYGVYVLEPKSMGLDAPLDLLSGTPNLATAQVGDVDNDSFPDIVATQSGGNTIFVALGLAGGNVAAPKIAGSSGAPDQSTSLVDVDKDGNLDLVVSGWDAPTEIFSGDGKGGFSGSHTVVNVGAYASTVADIDGDGLPDIAVAHGGGGIILAINQGMNTFATRTLLGTTSGAQSFISAVQVSGDPQLDLVTTSSGSSTVEIWTNDIK
jgi:hypothetical protein